MTRSGGGGSELGLQALDVGSLRELWSRGKGRFRDSGEAFTYRVRLLAPADLPRLVALHEEVISGLPDPLLLYPRDAEFLRECITDGCVAGAFHGPELVAYAALWVPGRRKHNYGRDIGLEGDELLSVGHLAGSAVSPRYRGNRLQRELVVLRNHFAMETGRHHMCGEVVPTNVISIKNHLAKGFLLTGHRIDDFGDRCFILHADLRRDPRRVPGDDAIEAPISDVERYREIVDAGRCGFEVDNREGVWHLRYGRFA